MRMKLMEIFYRIDKVAIGSVEVGGHIGTTVEFELRDGTTLVLPVTRQIKSYPRKIRAKEEDIEKIRLIPGFKEYGK